MRIYFLICSILLTYNCTFGQTGSLSRGSLKAPSEKITFKLVNNKTTLPVRIGDSRLLRIVLDSGMGWDGIVITDPDLIDSIKLVNPQDANIGGAGNSGHSTAVFADSMSFSVGELEFKDQRVVVLRSGGFRGGTFDGVTGYSIFGHYTVEVNYDKSEIILHQPGNFKTDRSWTEIPIYFKENMIPWIDAKIVIKNEEPVNVSCYIDYASSEAIELLQKPGQKFILPEKTEDYLLGRGLSGDINGRRGRISKVLIGPYKFNDVLAAFAPAEVRSKQKGADGVISNNLLRRFNLVFDYSKKRLFIKPNSFFNDTF